MSGDNIYDIAVVGGGAAGMMAAVRAGALAKKVVLIERNEALGRKVLVTGKGRCNITNTAPIETFMEKFGKQGKFLRTAFSRFSNEDLMDFFAALGLELKTERQGRVFPKSDKASSVIEVLAKCLSRSNVEVRFGTRITDVHKTGDRFAVTCEGKPEIEARKVILAMGGASYAATGSTGDGFAIARRLGHAIAPLKPGLVPLKTREAWVKGLQGLALENIQVTFVYGKKKIVSGVGELMFTHFGISGPIILDLSDAILSNLAEHKDARLFIDLKPGLTDEQLEKRLLNEFASRGNTQLKNVMKNLLPNRLVDVIMALSGADPEVDGNQVKQKDRAAIKALLKALPLTVTGSLPIEEAMVTGGGVSTGEIDPRSMESRLVPGLYFAGETIDGCAASGGYNLQQAFSTGYLAGECAAKEFST